MQALKQLSRVAGGVLLALLLVLPGAVWALPDANTFEPVVEVVGVLSTGALGLPGEPVTWIVTVTNRGTGRGVDLVIRDVLRDELRIDAVEVERGWQTVDGQSVEFSIPSLDPGETVGMQIKTTVLRGPADGVLTNSVTLRGKGPGGEVVKEVTTEIYVPTGLPATGYPPDEDLPGHDEMPLGLLATLAVGAVALTALVVYRRGSLDRGAGAGMDGE